MTLAPGVQVRVEGQPPRDSQTREQAFHERATLLRSQITTGWSPEQVTRIMGQPQHVSRHADSGVAVETWWYHGFQVGVEFRQGAVSNWFFRFMK